MSVGLRYFGLARQMYLSCLQHEISNRSFDSSMLFERDSDGINKSYSLAMRVKIQEIDGIRVLIPTALAESKPTTSMDTKTQNQLEKAANEYIRENRDTIETYQMIVPFSCIPEEEEDPEGWAEAYGRELDDSLGFTIVPISSGDAKGVALITVVGNSWEGLRIFVEGVFNNQTEAMLHATTLGIVCM